MKQSGQVVLLPFPFTDLLATKFRPALILRKAAREFDGWLVCMVSSQLHQMDEGLDKIVNTSDADFKSSGLKVPAYFVAPDLPLLTVLYLWKYWLHK